MFNVICGNCRQVFSPVEKSPAWWKAKKAADKGRLDAITVSAKDCGCEQIIVEPDAPFRVIGYDDLCQNYNIPCNTFVLAVQTYLSRIRHGEIAFLLGISQKMKDHLRWMI